MSNAVEGFAVLERAMELTRAGVSFAMATVVWRQPPSSGQQGSRAIVTDDGSVFGFIGGACAEPVLVREAKRVLSEGTARLLWLGPQEDFAGMHVPDGVLTVPIACQSDGALQIFIEPVLAMPHVVVVGRSPMAMTLLEMLQVLNWRAELVDYPDLQPSMIAPDSVVVVATQGHGDEEALQSALSVDCALVGLVASRKRGDAVLGFLAEQGVPAERIARVRVPMGLDLGHTTHREIAVAIVAELVQLRAAGALKTEPRRMLPLLEPAEVIDLVCGMTVQAIDANRPFEYNGTTYYFCAAGCRAAFAKDPESFIPQEAPC